MKTNETIKPYYNIDVWKEPTEIEEDPILHQHYKKEFTAAQNIKEFLRTYCGLDIKRMESIDIPNKTYIFDLISRLEILCDNNTCESPLEDLVDFHNLKWEMIRYIEKICGIMDQFCGVKYEEVNSRLLSIETFIESYPEFLECFELDTEYVKNLYNKLKEYHCYIKTIEANNGPVKIYNKFK